MASGAGFINPIEQSLLCDLVGLYSCDLNRELHQETHERCIACSKQAILQAIAHYRDLDAWMKAREFLPAPAD